MERQGITSVADGGNHYIIGYPSKAVLQRKGPNQATEPELDPMERVIVDFCKLHLKLAEQRVIRRTVEAKDGMVLGWVSGTGEDMAGTVRKIRGLGTAVDSGKFQHDVSTLLSLHGSLKVISE